MKTRIISSVVLMLLFIAILLFNTVFPFSLNIAISLISGLAVYELIKVMGFLSNKLFSYPSLAVAILIPLVDTKIYLAILIYAVYSYILFITLVFHHKSIHFKDLATIYSMSILIPTALLTIICTRNLDPEYGVLYTVLAILSPWIADVGAYFSGTFLGKHKLCPDISPKKTVEGFIGGTIFGMLGVVVIGVALAFLLYGTSIKLNYLALVLVGFSSALTSVIGDLSFSLIKRSCGVKDFGQVIPGHGGILDRFDSVIFTAPLAFFIIYNLPLVIR